MSTTPNRGSWAERAREAIEISKLLLRYGTRSELTDWGFDPELIEAVLAYREVEARR